MKVYVLHYCNDRTGNDFVMGAYKNHEDAVKALREDMLSEFAEEGIDISQDDLKNDDNDDMFSDKGFCDIDVEDDDYARYVWYNEDNVTWTIEEAGLKQVSKSQPADEAAG